MYPWTPRSGTDGSAIAGTWMILTRRLGCFSSFAMLHGPVTQNAALPLRKAFCAPPASTRALIRPRRFHRSTSEELWRNALLATPRSDGSRLPAAFVPKTYPPRPAKNGYMWYPSPDAPCWTASERFPFRFFLNASADFSSWLHVFGTLTSFVFTTSAMFSPETGMP